MQCPRCSLKSGSTLVSEVYEGVTIDRCPVCNGVWLDEGELGAIVESREVPFDARARQEAIAGAGSGISDHEKESVEPCPKCSQPMLPMNWGPGSGVIVDRCLSHGLWFDGGEIEKIQAYAEHWQDQIAEPKFRAKLNQQLQNESASVDENDARALSKFSPLGRLVLAFLYRFITKF